MRTIRYLIYHYSPLHLILYLDYFYYNDLHVLKLLKNVQSEPKLNSSLKFKSFCNFYYVLLCFVRFCYKLKKICIVFAFCNFYISSFIVFFCILFIFFLCASDPLQCPSLALN